MKFGVTGSFTGIVASTSFNIRLQPLLIQAQAPSQTVLSLFYTYGAGGTNNGNVSAITNNRVADRSQDFTYDALNRISTASSSGALWGEHFDIDAWGNLYKIRACQSGDACNGKPQGENLDKTADTSNRLVGGYTYDAAGNLLNDGGAYSSTYDAENRIAAYSSAAYTYDGDGRRVKKSTGTLYWTGTGSDALLETDLAGTATAEYVYFGGKRIARVDLPVASVHYYFSDHLGSADVVTNADGTAIEQESDYYPYGGERIVTAGPNHYKFTGKERDTESGLDYFGARYYASATGRWLSPDWAANATAVPYAEFGNPQSLNLYGYVENNPIAHSDIDGHDGRALGPFVCTDCFKVAADLAVRKWEAVKDLAKGAVGTLADLTRVSDNPHVELPPSNVPDTPAGHFGAFITNVGLGAAGGEEAAVGDVAAGAEREAATASAPAEISISRSSSPEAARHIEEAQAAGQPSELTVDRAGAAARRSEALQGTKPAGSGLDRDEYPPACCAEGGRGASVRNIPSGDNRSAGAQMGNQLKLTPDGAKIRVVIKPD